MGDHTAIVLKNTYTTAALQQRIALLKEFLEYAFYGAGGGQSPSLQMLDTFAAERSLEPVHVDALRAWGPGLWGAISAGTFYQTLNTLLASFKEVPVLTLYTPVKFPPQEMSVLGERIRALMGKVVLIDDHIDSDLSIGCAFVLSGVYHEYGLPFFVGRKQAELMTLITRYGSR